MKKGYKAQKLFKGLLRQMIISAMHCIKASSFFFSFSFSFFFFLFSFFFFLFSFFFFLFSFFFFFFFFFFFLFFFSFFCKVGEEFFLLHTRYEETPYCRGNQWTLGRTIF